MSFVVEVLPLSQTKKFALLDFYGRTTVEDFQQAFIELTQLPEYRPILDQVWDFVGAELEVSYLELQKIADYFIYRVQKAGVEPKVLFVADNAADKRLIETYIPIAARNPVHFELFASRADAIEWLSA
jgi:hypothetical protein